MTVLEIMKMNKEYCLRYDEIPNELQIKAKTLCWEYNQCSPMEDEKRKEILEKLLGTYHPLTFINYNCVILDTSPVNIGANVFIAPGVCIACAGHPIDVAQRNEGICTSKAITIGDDVWIGANSTVCGGVTIGKGSVIGAGSVVTKDIPEGVVAVGNPCRVLRKVTEADRVELSATYSKTI